MLLKKIEERYGIAVMYFHPWELLEIPKNIYLENNKRIRLPFLKRKFAYYKIPMAKSVEYLLGKIDFANFEMSREYIVGTLVR